MVDVEDKTIAEGRFISDDEVQRSALVVVLGSDIKEKFFPNQDALGKTLKVRGLPLRVVGVEEKRGAFFGDSFDRHIYIPVTTTSDLRPQWSSDSRQDAHARQLSRCDRRSSRRHADQASLNGSEEDDFGLVNVEEINNQIDQFTGTIATVVVPITMITLIVGGIVVMNIMLVCVTERTFEVGLRKALGATRSQILLQFLIESGILCGFGGIIGLLVAWGVTMLITTLADHYDYHHRLYALGADGLDVIGMIAGIYPAFKAARLDPILALTQSVRSDEA